MIRLAFLGLIAAGAACSDQRPPAPTADEAARLNDAEAMLDNVAADPAVTREGPADRSTGPSDQGSEPDGPDGSGLR